MRSSRPILHPALPPYPLSGLVSFQSPTLAHPLPSSGSFSFHRLKPFPCPVCSLYIRSSLAGARRGCCRHSLYTCFSVAGADRSCCRHSLYTCSSLACARRGCRRRSLYTGSSVAGARKVSLQSVSSWVQAHRASAPRPCLIINTQLGSHFNMAAQQHINDNKILQALLTT